MAGKDAMKNDWKQTRLAAGALTAALLLTSGALAAERAAQAGERASQETSDSVEVVSAAVEETAETSAAAAKPAASTQAPAAVEPAASQEGSAMGTAAPAEESAAGEAASEEDSSETAPSQETGVEESEPAQPYIQSAAQTAGDWRLLLVNPWNTLPENYEMELATLSNGLKVDQRICEDLEAMLDACREAGLRPVVCSAYRTQATQVRLYNNKIARLRAAGWDETTLLAEAARWVAPPGTSEHQTGLALDIVSAGYQLLDEAQADTAEQKWLMEHCWEYGFILRYPEDKTEITGIGYEPWHYRYVGRETAAAIRESGLCLEEYLQTLAACETAAMSADAAPAEVTNTAPLEAAAVDGQMETPGEEAAVLQTAEAGEETSAPKETTVESDGEETAPADADAAQAVPQE